MKEIKGAFLFQDIPNITVDQINTIFHYAKSDFVSRDGLAAAVGSKAWIARRELGMECDELMRQVFPDPNTRKIAKSIAGRLVENAISDDNKLARV